MPPNTSIQRYIKKNIISKPFNLLKGPLMKFYLIHDNQSKNLSYLIISAHHFIVDGTGAVVLGREISNAYNCRIKGESTYNSQTDSFIKCTLELRKNINLLEKNSFSKEFWLSQLHNWPLRIQLPNKKLNQNKKNFLSFELSPEEIKKLKNFARKRKSTLFILLASFYGILLSKYCNQNRLVLSYPIDIRPTGFSKAVGAFVNNIPLKIDVEKNTSLLGII
ncbi:condensation domain-containing protein [Coxiella burnetii]|uniref:condensation domain-containing protein n=2 Tax=Coxiella burnetii TaxID=777 RepID=UPI0009B5B90D|nr:condensation domain-containing protein [Coxiella burnetii]PHH57056.1 hypothetical protein CRH12_07575 [Coxiella burnetii]